jgi:diguanylate cyclase (GGDEF)-like protein/PAS domain S-box-containing protein
MLVNYLDKKETETINALSEQQLLTSKATFNAVIDTYTVAAKKDFNAITHNKKVMALLRKFKNANKQEQNIIRGQLYRLLYKRYDEMKKLYVRQFHFHTVNGESLLRFHLPYKNGDSLTDIRTSVKLANTEYKSTIGYEGGRIYPGYRYVFPLIDNGEHLGSVEFSISFEGIEKKLHDLLSYSGYQQIMTKSSTIDKVFPWSRHFFVPSDFSPNYYIENSIISHSTKSNKENPLILKLTKLAKSSEELQSKLEQHQDFSLSFISENEGYTLNFIAFDNIKHQHRGYIVAFNRLDKILSVMKNYQFYKYLILITAVIVFILLVIIVKQFNLSRRFQQNLLATNESLKNAQAIAHFGSWELDLTTKMLYWSDEVYRIFGLEPQSVQPTYKMFLSYVHPQDREKLKEMYRNSLEERSAYNIRHRIITKQGEIRHIEEHTHHKYAHDGTVLKSFGTVYDVTQEVESYLRLEKFVDLQRSIVILTDGQFFQFANKSFFNFFGYGNLDDFMQENNCICDLFVQKEGFFSLADVKENEKNWVESLLNLSERKRVVSILDSTDTPHAFAVAINKYDEQHFVIDFSDISDTMLEKLQLKDQVNSDQLTQTYNRVFFENSIHKIMQQHKKSELLSAIIFFDIDHFKKINDTYGHSIGDKVLVLLASLVKRSIRKDDYLIRWGGEEFVIIIGIKSMDDLLFMAENLRVSITKLDIKEIDRITCSFGIAIHKEDEKIKTTIARADDRLYEAKNSGRNCVKS